MPRGQSTRTRQLSLFTVRPYPPAAVTRQNRERSERAAQQQLARLAAALARQRPDWAYRRCEVCHGREAIDHPHQHAA